MKVFAPIIAFLSQFKSCRNSQELMLKLKFVCSQEELDTLEFTLTQNVGDADKIKQRIEELRSGLIGLPKGHAQIFGLFAFWFVLLLGIICNLYGQILPFVEGNWQNSRYLFNPQPPMVCVHIYSPFFHASNVISTTIDLKQKRPLHIAAAPKVLDLGWKSVDSSISFRKIKKESN